MPLNILIFNFFFSHLQLFGIRKYPVFSCEIYFNIFGEGGFGGNLLLCGEYFFSFIYNRPNTP